MCVGRSENNAYYFILLAQDVRVVVEGTTVEVEPSR